MVAIVGGQRIVFFSGQEQIANGSYKKSQNNESVLSHDFHRKEIAVLLRRRP